ncbi:DUF485 domain-containing protein [Neisseria weixii]|uniref:DUF485 domain-containing protein n=1 Tax=Neisseria weixii TaxID=1853276 RepID=A0A3N4MZY3_9NEIS|nr:DUF485 domain-containing protein [Neisseria weixii]RPD87026.1 DUF485 domain-containing protein [Neisseria weixii]RPD89230.1 DUF485 domain-containing protein [Neisseria weixii]
MNRHDHYAVEEQRRVEQVLAHPKFKRMAMQKSILGWMFSAVIFFVYVAFILAIGINPQLFAIKTSPGSVTTWGIYIGIFVIVFSFITTAIYVYIANGKFENMTQEVIREVFGDEPASDRPSETAPARHQSRQ